MLSVNSVQLKVVQHLKYSSTVTHNCIKKITWKVHGDRGVFLTSTIYPLKITTKQTTTWKWGISHQLNNSTKKCRKTGVVCIVWPISMIKTPFWLVVVLLLHAERKFKHTKKRNKTDLKNLLDELFMNYPFQDIHDATNEHCSNSFTSGCISASINERLWGSINKNFKLNY